MARNTRQYQQEARRVRKAGYKRMRSERRKRTGRLRQEQREQQTPGRQHPNTVKRDRHLRTHARRRQEQRDLCAAWQKYLQEQADDEIVVDVYLDFVDYDDPDEEPVAHIVPRGTASERLRQFSDMVRQREFTRQPCGYVEDDIALIQALQEQDIDAIDPVIRELEELTGGGITIFHPNELELELNEDGELVHS